VGVLAAAAPLAAGYAIGEGRTSPWLEAPRARGRAGSPDPLRGTRCGIVPVGAARRCMLASYRISLSAPYLLLIYLRRSYTHSPCNMATRRHCLKSTTSRTVPHEELTGPGDQCGAAMQETYLCCGPASRPRGDPSRCKPSALWRQQRAGVGGGVRLRGRHVEGRRRRQLGTHVAERGATRRRGPSVHRQLQGQRTRVRAQGSGGGGGACPGSWAPPSHEP